ncbi:MAG TPA: PAS domain S-box protein, partial [Thermoanaerobaculia bacterium]
PSGAEVWAEARSNPVRAADGGVLWNGIATDITARKKAEAALRESEESYRRLFTANPQPMWFFDTKTLAFLEVNDAAVAFYGFRRDEFLAMTIADIRPPEDVPRLQSAVGRIGEGSIDLAGVWKHLKKDGSIILVEITSHAVEYNRRPAEVVLVHDITTRMNAEAGLRESEERFRAIFEVAPVGVAQADPATGRWLAVNPRMCLITGYTEDELLTMRVPELTHAEDRARDWDLFQKVVKGEAPEYRIEKRYLRKDGSIAWVNVNMVVLRDAEGRPTRTLAMIEDITERKANETKLARLNSELAEALEWQRQIFEGSRDAVFLSDGDGRFVAVNGAAADLTGYSREEILAMSIPDLHDELDLKAYRTFHHRILDGEQILSEAPIRRKDGTKVAVEFNNSPVVFGGRRLIHTAGRDITERKKATEALAASESRYRVLFENASEGIVAIDPETGRHLFFNPTICAMFGYTPKEFRELTTDRLHPAGALDAIHRDIRLVEQGKSGEFTIVPCVRKDGSVFQADIGGSAIELEGRKVVFGFFTDVTDRLRLEEQLRQAQKMEAFGQLAGGVAHDFNNLLTVISGNTDLLLSDSPANDPKRGPLMDVRAAGERAANLTRQLLAFSRKQILEPRLVDVHEVVTGIEKMLRRLIGEDVEILTDLAADPSWVKVDPGQLEQVIMNLAVNARDAMPRGGRITIRTRNVVPGEAADPDETARQRLRPRVAISISDTGTGILPEVKVHLFEPFFTTKMVGKGTGLGLATVYGIVKQSGGDVTVESEPGKGATFTVILPSQPAPRRRGASGASLRAVPRGTETVLVVEDEEAVRRIVKIALESTGYRVIEARSG